MTGRIERHTEENPPTGQIPYDIKEGKPYSGNPYIRTARFALRSFFDPRTPVILHRRTRSGEMIPLKRANKLIITSAVLSALTGLAFAGLAVAKYCFKVALPNLLPSLSSFTPILALYIALALAVALLAIGTGTAYKTFSMLGQGKRIETEDHVAPALPPSPRRSPRSSAANGFDLPAPMLNGSGGS